MRAAGRRAFAVLAALAVSALAGAAALRADAGIAVDGTDVAIVTPPPGAAVEAYANDGYRLEIEGGRVRVTVAAAPLRSRAAFTLPAPPARPSARAGLARAVAAGATTEYDAVSRVLGWISRNVAYTLDRSQPQDPDAVLARRSAYCTGIARLAVALLAELAIRAREVPGYVVGGVEATSAETPPGYHRWIEVQYPDRGWVFSDPLTSHNLVPATYVRLASERIGRPDATGALVERSNGLMSVDVYPQGAPGVRARKNTADQLAAALRVVVAGGAPGTATLEGAGSRRTHLLEGGASTFLGLAPGDYLVRLLLAGKQPLEQRVLVARRTRQAVVFRLHDPAAATREETR